jgi:hypothetical protein
MAETRKRLDVPCPLLFLFGRSPFLDIIFLIEFIWWQKEKNIHSTGLSAESRNLLTLPAADKSVWSLRLDGEIFLTVEYASIGSHL